MGAQLQANSTSRGKQAGAQQPSLRHSNQRMRRLCCCARMRLPKLQLLGSHAVLPKLRLLGSHAASTQLRSSSPPLLAGSLVAGVQVGPRLERFLHIPCTAVEHKAMARVVRDHAERMCCAGALAERLFSRPLHKAPSATRR